MDPQYKLECGVCVNPCVVQFLPLETSADSALSVSDGQDVSLTEGRLDPDDMNIMMGESDKIKMREDLKKILLEEFFKEIISSRS